MSILWLLIKLVFCLVVAFAFLHTSVTHFILWYEWKLAKLQHQETIRLSFLSIAKSFLMEFLCVILKMALYPFQHRSVEFNPPPVDNLSPPIILVHGYLNHKADWLWFLKKIQKNSGIGPIHTLNLFPPFASISELALQLKNKVAELKKTTHASEVILIGHSMGGLVCSYFCEHLASKDEVAMVITLGSPFQGTKLSALGHGQNVIEMAPNSAFLSELNERIHQSKVPYYSIASKLDNMIIPWQSAVLTSHSSATENVLVLEDRGHLSLLVSMAVVEQITKWVTLQSKKTV